MKILIATPAYGGLFYDGYMTSLPATLFTLMVAGHEAQQWPIRNESFIPRARHHLAALFLALDFDYLMFIDADITWHPDAIQLLLDADEDIVGGAYPKKGYPISYAVTVEDIIVKKGNLLETKNLGTGFMLIKRHVIEKLYAAHPEKKVRTTFFHQQDLPEETADRAADNCYAIFDPLIEEDGTYLTEDYAFCRRWQALGGKVYIHAGIPLDHTGTHTFHGDIRKILNEQN